MKYSLSRYERHIDLPNFGEDGQERLKNASVAIIGLGGLGAPVSLYLAAAGIGNITLIDNDEVGLSNLQRQVIFQMSDLKRNKAEAALNSLNAINPEIGIKAFDLRLNEEEKDILKNYDVIIDCSDNFETRYLLNQVALEFSITLVSGSVIHYDGHVYTFKKGFACYSCLFPIKPEALTVPTCTDSAVLGPVPGVIGTLMAVEVIKEIVGLPRSLAGSFLIYNGLESVIQKVQIPTRIDCSMCGKDHGI